jgi:hypothetical protein
VINDAPAVVTQMLQMVRPMPGRACDDRNLQSIGR